MKIEVTGQIKTAEVVRPGILRIDVPIEFKAAPGFARGGVDRTATVSVQVAGFLDGGIRATADVVDRKPEGRVLKIKGTSTKKPEGQHYDADDLKAHFRDGQRAAVERLRKAVTREAKGIKGKTYAQTEDLIQAVRAELSAISKEAKG